MFKEFVTNVPYKETEQGDKIIYPFSPPIYQTFVDPNFSKFLLDEGRKLNVREDDYSFRLAGNLKHGRSYGYKDSDIEKAESHLLIHVEKFLQNIAFQGNAKELIKTMMTKNVGRGKQEIGKLKLDSLWINFSQQYDFNPPHTHTGALSFVIYLKVPQRIFEVQADSNSQKAGEIIFAWGENTYLTGNEYPVKVFENLMFIFPASLRHYVPAYWVDEERVSVSGNFMVM